MGNKPTSVPTILVSGIRARRRVEEMPYNVFPKTRPFIGIQDGEASIGFLTLAGSESKVFFFRTGSVSAYKHLRALALLNGLPFLSENFLKICFEGAAKNALSADSPFVKKYRRYEWWKHFRETQQLVFTLHFSAVDIGKVRRGFRYNTSYAGSCSPNCNISATKRRDTYHVPMSVNVHL